MKKFIKGDYLLFFVARAIGLLVKPVSLYFLIFFGQVELSGLYSKFLFAGVVVYSILNIPFHFEFYKRYFDEERFTMDLYFVSGTYKRNFVNYLLVSFPLIFFINTFLFTSLILALVVTIHLIIEKFFDEVQRFQQYKKEFVYWSTFFLLKTILPVIILLLLFNYLSQEGKAVLYITSITFINFFLARYYLKNLFDFRYLRFSIHNLKRLLTKIITAHGLRFFLILSFVSFNQLERFFLIIFDSYQEMLPEVTFLAQISNILVLFVSFFFIAHKRAFYIESNLSIKDITSNFVSILSSVLLFSLLLFIFLQSLDLGILEIELEPAFIFFHFLAFLMLAIDSLFTEHQFWNKKPVYLLAIDLVLATLFFTACSYSEFEFLSFYLFLTSFLRLMCHVIIQRNLNT